ncbi:bifunctional aldolase/short-chain dehydrogenase [Ruegeria sediminis]|uniref:Bifunctional aldolase/short-chain dehydrogenase n=1 Tax=Ruegeria sediminis TaxID=2583820 RepID=A0ABY2X1W8_9RHOB|nr:bifunctional aldolase/short-chain dehydrogenase [Ruegeria sediminis]
MENRYNETDAQHWMEQAGSDPADQELARRVYTSRLIGQCPDLVMHGGGNTSVKLERENLFGEVEQVLHVKGSGWDLDTILAPGLPGLRLEPLRRLRQLDRLSDEDMVNVQRCNLLDSSSPNPSIETLLHAFLPHRYVDHTHATPFLILANLPDAEGVCRKIFGERLGIVPYIMPGFALAKRAAEVYEADPSVEGLLLLGHGHFAFAETARESYDLIVAHTNEVAAHFGLQGETSLRVRHPASEPHVLPLLRGAIADVSGGRDDAMPVCDLRNAPDVMEFLKRSDLAALATRGTASPDHVIRIKGAPLVLPKAVWSQGSQAIQEAVRAFADEYAAMFERQAARAEEPKTMLRPDPKVVWIEDVGIVGLGADAKAAKVAADLAEQNARVRSVGEHAGGFHPIREADLFDLEYWSLEQAKLGKGAPPPLRGRVVMVTGGGGTIGRAIVRKFASLGADCVLVDRDAAMIEAALNEVGGTHVGHVCDVTKPGAAEVAMRVACESYGGLDILVSNAGAATAGALTELSDADIRQAFELNFFAHQAFALAAANLFRKQGRGGQILFNLSKQAVNPGKNFGAYGMPKATTMFLMRQLALELGAEGVRVNGVNADRIRSGLLTDEFIVKRAKAREVSEAEYMSGNLLGREVEARHVAEAFAALASAERTTAHVMTVDGGNIEAALR